MSRGRGLLRRRFHPRLRDYDVVPACVLLSIHMGGLKANINEWELAAGQLIDLECVLSFATGLLNVCRPH